MLVENLQEESLKGQRIVYDHMSSLNTTIDKFVVTKELAAHCKGACTEYNATLEENNWKLESNVMTEKRSENCINCISALTSIMEILYIIIKDLI